MDKLQTLKGFRDSLPDEAKKRHFVTRTLRDVFSSYGFDPLETPTLEYAEVLLGKYGEEADKLLYTFIDRGGRKVGMRYDQTVPLSRVVAQYQNDLPTPFKRFQIQPVWRAENTQKGRYREFLQCDIDIAGVNSPLADAEIIAVVSKAFSKLGFNNVRIIINDRNLFEGLKADAIITIDKLKKIGAEKVKEELKERGYSSTILEEIQSKVPTENLKNIIDLATQMNVPEDQIVFEPTLARGLDYYTGMILEVEIPEYSVGSVGGGGRYDNLIGMFAGRQIPAVGFAFGFDRILDAMKEKNLFSEDVSSQTKVLISVFSSNLVANSLELCNALRNNGIQTEIYPDENAKMNKQLKYAAQKNIPFVVIAGPEEVEKNTVTLKNMLTGEQKQITREQLPDEIN